MGNFGKRLLIVTLSALAVVALAIVGNTIQQSERIHKVSDSSNVVYGDITKGDLWDAIINSSITDTINEKLNRKLLEDVINSIEDDSDEVKDEIEYLTYGTNDDDEIDDLLEARILTDDLEDKVAAKAAYKNDYVQKMNALGYYGEEGQIDYAKLQLAYKKYALYRINNNKTVGSYDYSNLDKSKNEESWKTTIEAEKNYKDVYALGVFFNSTAEAKDVIKSVIEENGWEAVFDSTLAISKYTPKDSNGNPYLVEGYSSASTTDVASFNPTYNEQYGTYIYTSGDTTYTLGYSNEAFYQIEVEKRTSTVEYVLQDDETYKKVVSYTFEFLFSGETYDNGTSSSLTSSNSNVIDKRTANAGHNDFPKTTQEYEDNGTEYTSSSYNYLRKTSSSSDYYEYFKEDNNGYFLVEYSLDGTTLVKEVSMLTFVESEETFLSGSWYKTLVETVKKDKDGKYTYIFNLLNEYNTINETDYTEDDDFDAAIDEKRESNQTAYLALEESIISSGTIVSRSYDDIKNTALDTTSTFSYKTSGNEEFYFTIINAIYEEYYTKQNKLKYGTDNKLIKDFLDTGITYEDFDSTKILAEGYKIKDSVIYKYTGEDELTAETELKDDNSKEATLYEIVMLLYNISEDALTDSGKAKKVNSLIYKYDDYSTHSSTFATFLFDGYDDKDTLSDKFKLSSSSPYYLIYRLTDTELIVDYDEYRQSLIDSLINDSCFIEMALAELRKDAKVTFFDQFLVYGYQDTIEYDEDDCEFGISDEKSLKKYYTKSVYSSKKIARINKVTFTIDAEGNITSQNVSKKLKDRYNLTTDRLYDYAMERRAATYISSVQLSKTLKSMPEYKLIHGTDSNYLTSDNWRMTQYRNQVENLNYYYELSKNYPSVASYYGLGSYNSLKDYLFTYVGVRSWDRLVQSYMNETTRKLYTYKALVGNLDADISSTNEYEALESYIEKLKLEETIGKQLSLDISHLLISIDYNNDTYPDSYNDFISNVYNNFSSESQKAWDQQIAKLVKLAVSYVAEYDSFTAEQIRSKSSSTAWNSFVTEFNNSLMDNENFGLLKKYGLKVKYEALGTVTETTLESYDKAFATKVKDIYANETIADDEIYSAITISTDFSEVEDSDIIAGLTKSDFGMHLIFATKTEDYEPISFENLTTSIAKYLRKTAYESLFGSTNNPDQYANQVYSTLKYENLTVEDEDDLETLFSDELAILAETNASYISTYTILNSIKADSKFNSLSAEYKAQFNAIIDAYSYTLFGTVSE